MHAHGAVGRASIWLVYCVVRGNISDQYRSRDTLGTLITYQGVVLAEVIREGEASQSSFWEWRAQASS